MKKTLTIISFITVSLILFSCAQKSPSPAISKYQISEEFVQGSEDIPLLKSMKKTSEDSLGFDSDAGSIMSSSYETEDNLKNVRKFYATTLPQLGWKMTETSGYQLNFSRENERLEIEFSDEEERNIIRFFISSVI